MEAEIRRDEAKFVKHYSNRPRHTRQVDYYLYEHDLRRKVLPEGEHRARTARSTLAGRATQAASDHS
jgi:hypothetical protein